MRLETLLKICKALHITPDEILTFTDNNILPKEQNIMWEQLEASPSKTRETALRLLSVYLDSLI